MRQRGFLRKHFTISRKQNHYEFRMFTCFYFHVKMIFVGIILCVGDGLGKAIVNLE